MPINNHLNLGVHPRNHYTYCPRCAAKGTFYEHEMSFKCITCGFHFFMNAAAAVAAIIFNKNGELLLTRRALDPGKGMLDLPGGFINPNESAEEALVRELEEELDIIPTKIEYFGSFPNQYLFSGTTVFTIDLVFKCQVVDFCNLKTRDDVVGYEFVLPQNVDLVQIPFESVRNSIMKLKNEH